MISFPTTGFGEGRSFSLLYFEEDPGHRRLVEEALRVRGHRVCWVKTADEMHLVLDNEPIDAVLMDEGVDDALSTETETKLRLIERTTRQTIPLVTMSTRLSPESCAQQAEYIASVDSGVVLPTTHGYTEMNEWLDKEEILARVDGDLELLSDLVEIFLEDCPRLMTDIENAVNAGNSDALERSAHAFKGSVGNFTTDNPFRTAFELESMGRNGSLNGANEAFIKLKSELERLKPALTEIAKT